MVRAARDDVARVERHDRRRELGRLQHMLLHVVGVVVVAELAIDPELRVDVVRLPGSRRPWPCTRPMSTNVSKDLPSQAAGLPRPSPLAARRHVDHARVSRRQHCRQSSRPTIFRTLMTRAGSRLVHEDPRRAPAGTIVSPVRRPHPGFLRNMFSGRARRGRRAAPVVGDRAQIFPGRGSGAQSRTPNSGSGSSLVREAPGSRRRPSKPSMMPCVSRLRRVAARHGVGDCRRPPPLGEHAQQNLAGRRRLEEVPSFTPRDYAGTAPPARHTSPPHRTARQRSAARADGEFLSTRGGRGAVAALPVRESRAPEQKAQLARLRRQSCDLLKDAGALIRHPHDVSPARRLGEHSGERAPMVPTHVEHRRVEDHAPVVFGRLGQQGRQMLDEVAR